MASKKAATGKARKSAAGTTRKKPTRSHEELLGRVISDPAFRQTLFADPRKVLKDYYSGDQLQSAMGFVGLLQASMEENGDDALKDLRRMKLGFL